MISHLWKKRLSLSVNFSLRLAIQTQMWQQEVSVGMGVCILSLMDDPSATPEMMNISQECRYDDIGEGDNVDMNYGINTESKDSCLHPTYNSNEIM